MTIKDYANNNNFFIMNVEHNGINYEFKNVRKLNATSSNKYIVFDEKFVLQRIGCATYKLLKFCRLEEFSKQIDKIAKTFRGNLFEVEMLDKNDKNYIVQFMRNKWCMNKSILRIYEENNGDYMFSNPYGPALVDYEDDRVVKTRFYLSDNELNEFEIEVLKATKA